MKHLISIILLALSLTACISTMPYHISSHSSDHSVTTLIQDCADTKLYQNPVTLSKQQGLDPNKISLLNWNVHKGSDDNWQQDFQQLSQDKDIITLQEARLDDALHTVLDNHNLHWDLTSAFLYDDVEVGVLTASKITAITQCSAHIKEPFIRLPKTLLVSIYPLLNHDQHLLVANIHSINFSTGTKEYTEQIKRLQTVLEGYKGPMIIAGDFNSWSQGRIHIIEAFRQDLSLQALPYQNHQRTRVFGNAIDHIFYRGLTPTDLTTPEVTSSDHNPIIVNFSMPPISNKVLSNND